jgi:predicted nucleotidyltransferase
LKHPDLKLLRKTFQKYPDIEAVYLFGSAAYGKVHQDSDLDLGIIARIKGLQKKKLAILADLAHQGFCNVDLVFLERDDIVLKYEAVRQNVLVYDTPQFDRGATYSKIVRQYLDFCPYLSVHRKAYKKRILDGKT